MNSLYHKITWQLVQSNLDGLFQHVLLPILYFSPEENEEMTDDPQEWLNQQFSILFSKSSNNIVTGFAAEFYDPKATVIGFLIDMVKIRGKKNLTVFMKHIMALLNKYIILEKTY